MTTMTTKIEALAMGALVFLLTACASQQLPRPLYDDYSVAHILVNGDMQQCLQQASGCSLLEIENHNFSDAVVYLNGNRIGDVPGLERSVRFFIPNSALADRRCATVTVQLRDFFRQAWRSGKECITPGGHFGLFISDPFSTTSLTSWS
jgi:hypothetical protein